MADNNFEKSLAELEKIVGKLENGDCSLDDSIELFEKGMNISKDLRKTLDEAHEKIISLTDAEKDADNDF